MGASVSAIVQDISPNALFGEIGRILRPRPMNKDLIELDMKIIPLLDEMERGFKADAARLKELKDHNDERLLDLQKEIEKKLGQRLRLNSTKELGELLFDQLNLPPLRKTQKYSDSVSISVLERLWELFGSSCPFLGPLVEFKRIQPISKAIKTVLKKLGPDDRIHPEFNPYGCPTGRIYSYIQNLPREVRSCLVPDEEANAFIELDWSQQELRILAVLSGEPVFLDCFAKGEDLHKRVISEMFHKPISEVTPGERRLGKTINYGLIYGQEAYGLAWNLNISVGKAQGFIDQYFSALTFIKRFKEESEEKFWKEGFAETAFGRRTRLNLESGNTDREIRRGFNHQIQGTGADLLRFTLVRLYDSLKGKMARLKFIAHDAIYLESPKETSLEMAEVTKSIMEIDFKGVKLPVSINIHSDFSMGEGNL
jgi:DNA polymerase-1